jgi:hypothetical protein
VSTWGGGGDSIYFTKYNSSGFYQWVCQINCARNSDGVKIQCDASYVYLLTDWRAYGLIPYDYDGVTRISAVNSTQTWNIALISYNTSGYAQWTARVAPNSGGAGYGYDIAMDSSSNLYTIGSYNGQPVNVYNPRTTNNETTFNTYTNAGVEDTVIVKYNSSGTPQWVVTIGGTLADIGYAISCTASGNIIVSGTTTSTTLTFYNSNGTTGRTLTNSSGVQTMWLASYTSAGFINWASMMTVTAAAQTAGAAMSADGSVYITGYHGTGGATFNYGT